MSGLEEVEDKSSCDRKVRDTSLVMSRFLGLRTEDTHSQDFKRQRVHHISDDEDSDISSLSNPATEALERALDLDEFSDADGSHPFISALIPTEDDSLNSQVQNEHYIAHKAELSSIMHDLAGMTTR